jgi:hypothetical protein
MTAPATKPTATTPIRYRPMSGFADVAYYDDLDRRAYYSPVRGGDGGTP